MSKTIMNDDEKKIYESLNELAIEEIGNTYNKKIELHPSGQIRSDVGSDRLNSHVGYDLPSNKKAVNPYEGWSDDEILAEQERVNRHVSNAAMGLVNPANDFLDTFMYATEAMQGKASAGDVALSLANFLPFAAFGKMKNIKQLNQLNKLMKLRGIDNVDDILKHSDELGWGGPRKDFDPSYIPNAGVDGPRFSGRARLDAEVDDVVNTINRRNKENIKKMNRREGIKNATAELQPYVEANPNLKITYDKGGYPRLHNPPTQEWIYEVPGITDRPGAYKDFPQFHDNYNPGYLRQGRDWVADRVWNENASKWIKYPVKTAVGAGTVYGGYKGGQYMGFWGEQPARNKGLGIKKTDSNSIFHQHYLIDSLQNTTDIDASASKEFKYDPSLSKFSGMYGKK